MEHITQPNNNTSYSQLKTSCVIYWRCPSGRGTTLWKGTVLWGRFPSSSSSSNSNTKLFQSPRKVSNHKIVTSFLIMFLRVISLFHSSKISRGITSVPENVKILSWYVKFLSESYWSLDVGHISIWEVLISKILQFQYKVMANNFISLTWKLLWP